MNDRRTGIPHLGWAILTLGVAAILLATLTPAGAQATESAFSCIFCGERALADVLVNIILYAPFGVGLALVGLPPRRAVLAAAGLSAVMEVIQIALPGRDSSIGDVLANTGGAALGVFFVATALLWLNPPNRVAGRLALGWSLMVVGIWALTGWLLQPSFPKTTYWGQWTPNLGHLEWYRGRVLSATVGGKEIRSRRAPDSKAVRRDLLDGAPIEVQFVAGPPTLRLSSIFSVYDEDEREIVLIGPDRDDLVIRYRTRATALSLDQPDLRLTRATAELKAGDTVSIGARRSARGWNVAVGNRSPQLLGLTIGRGWGIIYYAESFPDWLRAVLDVAWMAGLMVPIGYFIRRGFSSIVAVTVCLVAATMIPVSSGLLGTPAPLWIAMALGVVVGAAGSHTFRHMRHTSPPNDTSDS